MVRKHREGVVALALAALLTAAAGRAPAQGVVVTPPCEAPPAVSYYTPPTGSYYSPPAVSYYTPPAVSFYTPPAVSYYAPAYAGQTVTTYRRGILPWRQVAVTRYYAP